MKKRENIILTTKDADTLRSAGFNVEYDMSYESATCSRPARSWYYVDIDLADAKVTANTKLENNGRFAEYSIVDFVPDDTPVTVSLLLSPQALVALRHSGYTAELNAMTLSVGEQRWYTVSGLPSASAGTAFKLLNGQEFTFNMSGMVFLTGEPIMPKFKVGDEVREIGETDPDDYLGKIESIKIVYMVENAWGEQEEDEIEAVPPAPKKDRWDLVRETIKDTVMNTYAYMSIGEASTLRSNVYRILGTKDEQGNRVDITEDVKNIVQAMIVLECDNQGLDVRQRNRR